MALYPLLLTLYSCREATFSISLKNKKKGGVISGIRRIYLIFVWNKIEQKLDLAEIRK
jgi:hypothetical protein